MSIERSIIQKLRESREVEDEELLDEEFEDEVEDEEVVEENCEDGSCEEDELEEGRYTGTTTVRNIAKKVLQNHGLNNSTGKYDRFVNRVYNLYKETLLDEDELEAKMEREFKKMYPGIKESKRSPLEESIFRRLTEAWAPSLNKLRKPEQDVVRRELTTAGIDIENTPYKEVYITNGRDPRLRGMNVVIFELINDKVAVWFHGKFIITQLINWENINKMSWKTILSNSKRIISIEFDEKAAQELKNKRDSRKESQKGVLQRYNKNNKPKYTIIDKSGYVVDPNKYKDMLAKMKVNDGAKVLQQAKDMYTKLAKNIDKIDWDHDNDYYNYDNVMRGILRGFQQLSGALSKYEEYKKNPIDKDDEDRWWGKNLENQVAYTIKELREVLNKGKKYL